MKDIAIYGAGGLGKEVACLIDRINKSSDKPLWKLIGFFDDGKAPGTTISYYGKVLGCMEELNTWDSPISIIIAIGNPKAIQAVRQRINNSNIDFPNLIDPSFMVTDKRGFKIGSGNIIQGNCCVSCDTEIGNFNVFNGDVAIGHDVTIGNFNVIMPDIRISGEVTISDRNLLGVGSIVLQQIKVGNNVHLGAGAVLMTKPKDGNTYIGNPAKRFKF
jgi:sugar O-acyltransferase (sialic acid O-acetyltransferase NeuD family)